MRKNLTKKLFLSVLTLAFAVISLGASTYAWFTLSKDAEVQAFDANVTVGSGLLLQAVEVGTLEENLDEDAWQTASLVVDASLYDDVVFQAATPANKLSTVTGFVDASVKGDDNKPVAVPTSGYVQFDLYFKLTTPDTANTYDLYFDGYKFESSNVVDWTIDKPYQGKDYATNADKYGLGKEIKYQVQDAARLAITSTTGEMIYEAAEGSDEYTEGIPTHNAAINYYNEVNPTAKLSLDDACLYPSYTSVGEKTLGQQVGTLTGSATVKVTVTVWIEGWDAECINAIFSQTLATSLSFYLGDKTPVTPGV